jgi:heptaprenyl diphosphate synthase
LSKKVVLLGLFIAIASILFSIETFIATPIPWIRLGLANILTLLALKWWGIKEAVFIVIMRVVIGSFFTGTFTHPVFLLSISGGVISALSMGFLLIKGNQPFSIIGISIIGAIIKNLTQLIVAYLLYVRQIYLFYTLPMFLLSSLVAGFIIGFLVRILDRRIVFINS